nr:hypothetical protein [Candidatus Woesearchaeota archaeon]
MQEKIRESLSNEQIKTLEEVLKTSGFLVGITGHVYINNGESPIEMPVGYFDNNQASLVNLEKFTIDPYHSHQRLKEIFQKI